MEREQGRYTLGGATEGSKGLVKRERERESSEQRASTGGVSTEGLHQGGGEWEGGEGE